MSESSYFLILSSVEKLCIFKPKTSRLSSYLIHWNISDASLGTEELAHWEMLGTMIYQSIQGASIQELEAAGLLGYYTMHKRGVYPASPEGVPFTAAYIASTGDPIADIVEDLSAEQKARATYENLMDQTDCPEYINPLRFLRQREIVHYQRFGECLEILQSIIPNNNEKVRFVANGRVIDSGCACVD